MTNAKYVVVKMVSGLIAMETPIIFPNFISHADIVSQLGLTKDDVTSAGFVDVVPGRDYKVRAVAFGKSTTLEAESNPVIDNTLISRFLGLLDNATEEAMFGERDSSLE